MTHNFMYFLNVLEAEKTQTTITNIFRSNPFQFGLKVVIGQIFERVFWKFAETNGLNQCKFKILKKCTLSPLSKSAGDCLCFKYCTHKIN